MIFCTKNAGMFRARRVYGQGCRSYVTALLVTMACCFLVVVVTFAKKLAVMCYWHLGGAGFLIKIGVT